MKKLESLILIAILIICTTLLSGCSSNNKSEGIEEKLIVGVTIVPEKTFVEAVCGDLVEVITMVPPGNSPGNYEPTPQEMEKFSKSSLYFTIGVPTEEANILPVTGDIKTVALHDEVALVYPDRTFESGERDPHIWLSPKRVKVMIETIAREMIELDDSNKEIYNKNAQEYIKKLDELDQQIVNTLQDVQSKKIIVYHPAFGYLADDYGMEMYALQEDGKEATINHLEDMIDLAKEENIRVIFYQEEIDSSQSQAFAEEIGGQTTKLAPLDANYIDNLKNMVQIMEEEME